MKGLLSGAAVGHPTHPMLVHFPTALYPGAFVLGLLSRTAEEPAYLDAAAVLLGIGLALALLGAGTGLVDWLGMVPRSTKRRRATTHMLVQVGAQGLAGGAFVVHLVDLGGPASVEGLALLGAAVLVTFAGNWLGGLLVYRWGMRVGAGPSGGS